MSSILGWNSGGYVCPKCGRHYKYGDSRERHMKQKHGKAYEVAEYRRKLKLQREAAANTRLMKHFRESRDMVVKAALAWSKNESAENRRVLRDTCRTHVTIAVKWVAS